MSVCQKLRLVRLMKGLSLDYVAVRLGIDKSTYSRMERGKVKIDAEKLPQIAGVLEVDIGLLLCDWSENLEALIQKSTCVRRIEQELEEVRLAIENREDFNSEMEENSRLK